MGRAFLAGALVAGAATLGAACASAALPQGEGAALYRKKCGGCHRLYTPSEFKGTRWEERLTRMTSRAKLNEEEAAKIRVYVTSNREGSQLP